MAIKLGGQSALEQQAVRARLEGLGVAVGASGELKAEDFAKAKVSLEDVQRVAGSGALDLAQLESLTHHQRRVIGIPVGKVELEIAGVAEAKATVEAHRAQLELAHKKLGAIALDAGSLTEGGKLGSLAALLDEVAHGVAKVRTHETLAGVSASDLTALGAAHARVLDGYADLAQAIQRDAFELSRSKGQMASVTRIFSSLATLADALPAFDPKAAGPTTAQGAQAAQAADARLGSLTDTHATIDAFAAAAKLERSPELEAAVTPIFDRAAFRALPDASKSKWVEALATLPLDQVASLSGPLAALLSHPVIGRLPPERLERAVDLLSALPPGEQAGRAAELRASKLDGDAAQVDAAIAQILRPTPGAARGLLDPKLSARVDGALATVSAHLAQPLPKASFAIAGEARLSEIDKQLGQLTQDNAAADKQSVTDRAKIESSTNAAIDALPGIVEHREISAKVGALEKQRAHSEDRLSKAEYIIRDWSRTQERDKWKLNHGSHVAMGYFEDQETAEVIAPRVRREESRALGKLDAQLEALEPEIAKMKAFHAAHIAPLLETKTEALRSEAHERSQANRDRNGTAKLLKDEARDLLKAAAADQGQSWIFSGSHLSSWAKNPTYDAKFKLNYSETRTNVMKFQRVMTAQRAQVAEPLGLFAVAARASRDENLTHLSNNVDRLEKIVAGGALDSSAVREANQRVAWDRVTSWLNRVNAQ